LDVSISTGSSSLSLSLSLSLSIVSLGNCRRVDGWSLLVVTGESFVVEKEKKLKRKKKYTGYTIN